MMEALTEPDDLLGEGATWDDNRSVLWWVDILEHLVRRLDPARGVPESWDVGDDVGWLALRRDAGLGIGPDVVIGLGRSVAILDPGTGSVHRRLDEVDGDEGNRMNDGGADPRGRFWFGTMDRQTERRSGSLFRLDPDWGVHRVMTGLDIPNSICFSPDGSTMYFTETRDRTILALDRTGDGDIGARRVFATAAGPGDPDGSCVDAEGHLWNAEWGGSCVVRYAPDGTVDRIVEVPAPQVTCPVIGGTTLYVTTARDGMSATDLAEYPGSGAVFAMDVGVEGVPTPLFAG